MWKQQGKERKVLIRYLYMLIGGREDHTLLLVTLYYILNILNDFVISLRCTYNMSIGYNFKNIFLEDISNGYTEINSCEYNSESDLVHLF